MDHSYQELSQATDSGNYRISRTMADMPKTIAFFGATGDCAGYCLAQALQAGYTCNALARNPSKLIASLKAKDVRSSSLDAYLTIVHGDAKDPIAVKKALMSPLGGMVSYIVSGVGSTPKFQWNLWHPITLKDPTICHDVGTTILAAATGLADETSTLVQQRPFLLNVSTTGIPAKGCPRDVPLLFYPLYMYALHATHVDKSILEAALAAHINKAEKERGIRAFVNVKPSLLLDGAGRGLESVREGSEDAPAVGYTIQRADVGRWMFERGLKEGLRSEYVNRSFTITY